ncbi:MAG TPA: hypothetical protein VK789_16265 [Bryobacteraceae bacterium]|nr:hypothetical protein [Bryobacteraceae bacterium]
MQIAARLRHFDRLLVIAHGSEQMALLVVLPMPISAAMHFLIRAVFLEKCAGMQRARASRRWYRMAPASLHNSPAQKPNTRESSYNETQSGRAWRSHRDSDVGVSQDAYLDKGDAWPLNPSGELLLGVKLEDKYAFANAESLKVPGIGFAERGLGDKALSLGVSGPGAERDPKMVAARVRVFGRRCSMFLILFASFC